MTITAAQVKELREKTGAGVMECRSALESTAGDMEKAAAWIKERGLAKAEKKTERAANQGLVEAYIHGGGQLGVLVEVNCETDFVARTDEFRTLAHDIALQIAATQPQYVSPEEIPVEISEGMKAEFRAQALGEGKPAHIVEQIVAGKMQKFYQEACLLNQPFIRDETITVGKLITEAVAKLGENIKVRRFARFKLGQ